MNIEEFDGELSSDDSDYNPEKNRESVSENSGPEEDYPEDSDKESAGKKTKKSKKVSKGRRKQTVEDDIQVESFEPDREAEKRKADALWADFMEATETTVEPKIPSKASSSSKPAAATTTSKPPVEGKQIFEFAGEKVEVPVKTVQQQTPSLTATTSPKLAGIKRSGGGLSAALNDLNKKSKLSVLEKTKIDWDGFKDNEGIGEELQTHNRGRDGFLERRDFLERTDLRQFEIEKSMRLTRRK